MPLENRVSPFGNIMADANRGSLTGNRGVLHDPHSKKLHPTKRWTSKAWIYCRCDFKNRKRDVFGQNGPNGSPGWTNLFFLDEATALAAGHRPCFYCQRERAKQFQAAFSGRRLTAPEMDRMLHGERLNGRRKNMHKIKGDLPDGAMVSDGQNAFLVCSGEIIKWSFSGYQKTGQTTDGLALLTPPSIVNALRNGFAANLHPSICANFNANIIE